MSRLEVCDLTLTGYDGKPSTHVVLEGIADKNRQECHLVVTVQ